MRAFLREFLSDRRVVDANPLVWWLVLNGIVLPFRAPRTAALYASIWTAEGSPILVHSRAQRDALRAALGPDVPVALGMRYGSPSLADALDELGACTRVVLLPLFPQFSDSTTGSLVAEIERLLAARPRRPALDVVPPCFDDPGYVSALAQRVREACAAEPVEHHVFSFHGLPASRVERGDPYAEQCRATAELLARELALAPDRWTLVYQSRFGPERWLEPYADRAVPELAGRFRRIAVAMPGFASDCLETLEEIGIRLRRAFRDAGGEELVVVPALDDHAAWIAALAGLVRRKLASLPADRYTSRS